MSFSNIVDYVYKNQDNAPKSMGSIILIASFGTFMVFNSVAPSLGLKFTSMMKLAALTYSFNYVCEALLLSGIKGIIISVLGAMVSGAGASLLWVSYGGYMTSFCKAYKEEEL